MAKKKGKGKKDKGRKDKKDKGSNRQMIREKECNR